MRIKIIVLFLVTATIMAACGSDSTQPTAPTPTPVPTLTVAERIEFNPGTIQNPLRMVLVPTDTVPERVNQIVSTLLDESVSGATDLNLADNVALLDQLNANLGRDFGVMIEGEAITNIADVADLTAYVAGAVKTQAEEALFEVTRLNFELVMVEDHSQALTALCESDSGLVSMSWLDGITYFAAQALNCSQPSQHDLVIEMAEESLPEFAPVEMVVESEIVPESTPATEDESVEESAEATEENAEGTAEAVEATAAPTLEPTPVPETNTQPRISGDLFTGVSGLLVMSSDLEEATLQVIPTEAFCRVNVTDFFSWFVPTLIMERDNLMPPTILDFEDPKRIARAIRDGDCLTSGMSQTDFDALAGSLQRQLTVVETTPRFPFGVLMYPLDVQLGERVNLSENLPVLAADDTMSRPLRLLLGQDAFVLAEDGAFADLETFILTTGADLEQFAR